jgi:DNA polymerase I-like protein with 3'-5' exonuclease and polymerase domains
MDHDIIKTAAAARALAKDLKRCPTVAWDTETDGLDWIRGHMFWMQFSDGKKAWLVDIRKVDPLIFKSLLEGEGIKIIHNSAFDAAWVKREFGINVRNIIDTRYQEQMILGIALPRGLKKAEREMYEPLFSASLKWCLKRRGWADKMIFTPFFKDVEPDAEQIEYMVRDVEFLHALAQDQHCKIEAMGLQNVQILENEICEVVVEMMNNGFGIDKEGWLKYAQSEERIVNRASRKLKKIADINWGSWQQFCNYFGVHRTDDLAGYQYRSDRTPQQHEAYELFSAIRDGHVKNTTTYGVDWITNHVHRGLVRCQYTQMVNTSRFSCDNPNLQNIPAETKHRSFMIPGHGKNNVFIAADFSSQEMAIMAVGAQEQGWLECLRKGDDLHGKIASEILSDWDSYDEAEKKRQRKIVKIINFSIAYGAGTATIAERAGVDEDTIVTRLSAMKRKYPALFNWLNTNGKKAKVTWESYSMPPFNRYRSLVMETEGWRRVNIGKNNPVQATAADLSKLAMYLMWQKIKGGLKAWFIHMLHDELIIECHQKDAGKVSAVLVACMNQACIEILGEPLSNPEVKIKTNWSK